MKNRASHTYNQLYNQLRSKVGIRNLSFELNTFYDGSAAITIRMSIRNATVSLKMLITPEFDENEEIVQYRISEEDQVGYAKDLNLTASYINRVVQQTRLLLAKV